MSALLVALALALAAAGPPPASAATPRAFEGPAFAASPEALTAEAALLPADGREHLDVLDASQRNRLETDGSVTSTTHFVARVLSKEGATFLSIFSVGWPGLLADRPAIRARVVTPDGVEHLLDQATVVEASADEPGAQTLSDRRLLKAPLPAVQVGAVVEIEYQTRAPEPVPGTGQTFAFWVPHTRERRVTLVLDAPAGLQLQHGIRAPAGGEPGPVVEVAGGRRVLTWRWRDAPLREVAEPGSPAEQADPVILASTGRSWGAVADAYRLATEQRLAGQDAAALAREIAGGAASRDEAAQRVLDWVAGNFRYTALELGVGAYLPAPLPEVLRRRFGDCKDLSALTVALLRALGYEAHLALVRLGAGDPLASVPGLGGFDHAIVQVGGLPVRWLDPTAPELPVGVVPPQLEGKLALVIRPGARTLEPVPENTYEEDDVVQERELRLTESGKASAREVSHLGPAASSGDRRVRRLASPQAVQESLEKDARERLRAERVTVKVEEAGRRLTETVEATGSSWGSATDDAAEARLEPRPLRCAPAALLPWTDASRRARKAPLLLDAPCRREIRLRVVAMPGMGLVGALPPEVRLAEGPFRFEATFALAADGAITARYRIEQRRGELGAAQVARVRAALQPLGQEGPKIELRRTSLVLLEAGRGREALEELKRLVVAEPERLDHRVHLALALKQLGLGASSREAAREAVALAPGSGWAHRVLELTLEADALGRRLEAGCDLTGALAAQRRAVELEPGSPATRGYLGQLLLRGDDCLWFGRGADPREAAEVLRASLEALEDPDRAELLMQALLASGRPAEAVALARGRRATARRNAALLAGLALSEGSAAAAAEASRLTAEERGDALGMAALFLARERAYLLAAGLLETGAPGAKGGAGFLAMAEWYRRARRLPAGAPAAASPEALAAELARAGAGLRPLESLVAGARGDFEPDQPRRFAKALPRDHANHGVPEVLADLAAAEQRRWEPAGDAGGRLQLGQRELYAVREAGAWRLLATGGETVPLAWQALAELGAGRPELARRWLAWAVQDFPEGEYRRAVIDPLAVGPESPPAALRRLAAVFGGPRLQAADARAVLEAALQDGPEAVRPPLHLALADLHFENGRNEEALASARAALAAAPASKLALRFEAQALGALGRREELARLAARVRKAVTHDPATQRSVAQAAQRAGDLDLARELLEELAEPARASATDLNNLAWLRLHLDGPLGPARREAQRAAEHRDADASHELHTLATVLAADGEPLQAMETLRKVVERRGAFLPTDDLVVGKVAEAYGVRSAALAAYRRVEAEGGREEDQPVSVRALARRWRESLEARAAP